MKEFIVKTEMSEVKFNFPTKLEELTSEYLLGVTSGVTVAPNYSLIGLVYHEKLSTLFMTCRNKKKNTSIGIIPIFIKSGKSDESIVSTAKVGQKILISNSQIQLAHHCAAPTNLLNLDYFAKVIDANVDKDLYQTLLVDSNPQEVLFVEFKIVPNCDIIALYDKPAKVDNPYITVTPLK